MKLTEAMNRLICETPTDESGFRMFLEGLPLPTQLRLILVTYEGARHLHHNEMLPDANLDPSSLDITVPNQREYAKILHSKRSSLPDYFAALERCAENSGYDLNKI